MRTLIITPPAEQDLRDIWTYIADFDMAAADRTADRIDAAIRRLHAMPGIGHQRADLAASNYRFFTVHPYMIGYEYDDAEVEIVRVLHGRRDFTRAFP